MRYTLPIPAVLVVVMATLTGCVTVERTPEPVGPSATEDPVVRSYIDALAAGSNPSKMRDGLRHTADGSVAHHYLAHRANYAEALKGDGDPLPTYQVTAIRGGYTICDPAERALCGTITDLQTDGGKVINFSVDGQQPGPRLTVGDGTTFTDAGVAAEFLTAYNSVQVAAIWVAIRVKTSSKPVLLDLRSAVYQVPGESVVQPSDAAGQVQLSEASETVVGLQYPDTQAGGTVTLIGRDPELNESILIIPVGQ